MNTFQASAEMFKYFKQRRDDKHALPFTPPPAVDPIGFDEDISIPVKPFSSAPAPSPRNRPLVNREDILRRGDEIAAVREARRAGRKAEFDSYGSLLSSPRLEQQSPAYPDGDPNIYRAVVRDVLLGRYGNGQEREDNLKEAGLHPEVVRNMVNEQIRLGSPILDEFEDNTPVVSPPVQEDISTGQIEPVESVDVSTTQGDPFDQLFESSGLNALPEEDRAAALKALFNEISAENIHNQVMPELSKETIEGTKQAKKSNEEIASEILTGIWGNGEDRKKALAEAGYDPAEVQTIVNQMMHGQPTNEVKPPRDLPTPESTFKPELNPNIFAQPIQVKPTTQLDKKGYFNSPQEFVQHIYPLAREAGEKLGLDPKVLVAQAALETGWGKYMVSKQDGSSSFNLFNIKADQRWKGSAAEVPTLEYRNGQAKQERWPFRAYSSLEESMQDYVNFLRSNPRYDQALKTTHNSQAYIQNLQQAGYATDPNYAKKIINIMDSSRLAEAIQGIEQSAIE